MKYIAMMMLSIGVALGAAASQLKVAGGVIVEILATLERIIF